jgi:branched-chain amino acid transport system permease protein
VQEGRVTQLVQALALGVLIGGVYALLASGLTLIFGVMRIINVAQGAFLVLVAMVTWWLWRETGLDPIVASVVTTPLMFGFGWVLYRLLFLRIADKSPAMSVLLTFGLALTVEGVLNVTAGNKYRSATPAYFEESFRVGGVVRRLRCTGSWPQSPYWASLRLTGPGPAGPSATSQNPTGRRGRRGATSTAALAFAIGTATAGVGGSIMSVLYPFFPASHYDWISRLLGIIVLGGMGSLPGALVGALVLGLGETLTATYGSLRWSTLVFYFVILVVLLLRPQGLFGIRLREDAAT